MASRPSMIALVGYVVLVVPVGDVVRIFVGNSVDTMIVGAVVGGGTGGVGAIVGDTVKVLSAVLQAR